MKINASRFSLPFLILLALMSSSAVHADSVTTADTQQPGKTILYPHKTPDPHHKEDAATELKKNSKKILIEESREMSPFFKLGIAINIIMILVFAWWFRKEWRRKKIN